MSLTISFFHGKGKEQITGGRYWNNHQSNLLTLTHGKVPTEARARLCLSNTDTHSFQRLLCCVQEWDHINPGSSLGRDLSAQETWKTILRTSLPDNDVARGHAGFATQGVWRTVLLPSGAGGHAVSLFPGNTTYLNGCQQHLQLGKAPVTKVTFILGFPLLLPVVSCPSEGKPGT